MSDHPRVRVVVLNFDGGQMTIDCIESLLATDWPAAKLEVVLVDNGSLDDVVERIERDHPAVRVIEPLANLGFAGGCNLGIEAPPIGGFEPEFVALVNNDATVDRAWLTELHRAISIDSDIGAVSAKMLFADPVNGVEFSVRSLSPSGPDGNGESVENGMRITGLRVDGDRDDTRVVFDEGVFGPTGFMPGEDLEISRWTKSRGAIRVKVVGESVARTLDVRLSSLQPARVTFAGDGYERTFELSSQPTWVRIELPNKTFDVINNVGSNLYAGGFGGDRGFLEPDDGQYEVPAEVFAWCGGAVLLDKRYLDSVGVFDERLFLYYEDTDLSWRGRLAGWRYLYEPGAVVRHRHAQSSGVGSSVFRFHTERNRLLVLAKCAPARLVVRSGLGELRRMIHRNVKDLFVRPLTLRSPIREEARHRRQVFFSYVSLLPSVLRDRWLLDRRVSRRSIMAWQVHK